MLAQKTYIDNHGKLAIPFKVRKMLKLKAGDEVSIQYNDKELIVTTFHSNLDKARNILKQYNTKNLLEELKSMRKEDAAKE